MFDTNEGQRLHWPKAVIFDLDGTLIDSVGDIGAALNTAMTRRGYPAFDMIKVKEMIGGGIPKLVERAFLSHGITETGLMPVIAEFLEIYGESCTDATTLYDGALPLLQKLHANGVKIGLCTNKQQEMTEKILRGLEIYGYFGSIVGERKGQPRKPDPEPLRLALRQLDVAAHDAVMVGDSGADSGTAQAAGVAVVLVSYGYTHTPVEQLGADAVIDHLDELEAALASIKPLHAR